LVYEFIWPKEKPIIDKTDGFNQNYYLADADISELKIAEPEKHSEFKFLPLEQIKLYCDFGYDEIKSKLNQIKNNSIR
jgi:hypothetical protein